MMASLKCVLDASVCIKQFIADPLTPKVNQLFDLLKNPSTEFFVPDLFYVECANVLWKYVRSNLYTADQIQSDLADLKDLRFQVTSTKDLIVEAIEISLQYGITAYDACYVALSHQFKIPLLTLDERLVNALLPSSFEVRSFTVFELPEM